MKPILFNTEMVMAILDGRKTVTRRLINPRYRDDEYGFNVCTKATGEMWVEKYDEDEGDFETTRYVNPPYKQGDVIYVRETWQEVFDPEHCKERTPLSEMISNLNEIALSEHEDRTGWNTKAYYVYKADNLKYVDEENFLKWRPSLHMPKEAARIFLRVTDVRIKRLQDMNGNDFEKEGIKTGITHFKSQFNNFGNADRYEEALQNFSKLWNGTIKPVDFDQFEWEANPWVWVIEFERCDKPKEEN